MSRLFIVPLFAALLTVGGCGSSTEPTAANNDSGANRTEANPVGAAAATTTTAVGSPVDVVSQFLDEIRRGGADSRANDLLTQKAQSELKRIGQSVQPIGSPDAGFQVTRFEKMPDDASSALVHSIWSEPNGDGTNSQFQVVWAVHLEPVGWRISGLAMELDPAQPPMVIDFENGDLMAQLLAPPADDAASPTQATADGSTISR